MIRVEVLSMEQYRRFLSEQEPHATTLYHDPAWLESVQAGLGLEATVLGLMEAGEAVAVLPGFLSRKWGVRLFGSPLRGSMTPYQGWLTAGSASLSGRKVLEAVHAFCTRRLGCHYLEIGMLDPPLELRADAEAAG